MVALVLDASVVLAVALQESNRDRAAQMLDTTAEKGAAVPCLWHVEVGNALLTAERRKALSADERAAALAATSSAIHVIERRALPRPGRSGDHL